MSNNNMMIFENKDFGQVRSVLKDGEPWFVAADVCKALEIGTTAKALERLDPDEKGMNLIHTLGGKQKMSVVSESGLYSLILGSRKPEAKAFKRWITHEVIPSIRKHGAYVTDTVLDQMDEHPELISEYIGQLRAENAEARKNRELLEQARTENALLAPKANYYDSFVNIESLTCLRYTAKEIGVPQKKFIGYLLEKGYVFRDRHRNGRVFARAGKRNDSLFVTKDFYLPGGEKSEYTLVTPAGKAHFLKAAEKIRAWEPGDCTEGEDVTEQAVFTV